MIAPKITLPWYSVVIPNYGAHGVTLVEACLASLRQTHAHLPKMEVFVVDDGSGPHVVEALQAVCAAFGATLLVSKENVGFSKACNIGLRACNGAVNFLVNSDIIFTGDQPCLQILGDFCIQSNAGVIGPRLLYPDRTIQHAGVEFVPTPGKELSGYFDHIGRGQDEFSQVGMSARPCLITGALMGVSRNAINTIGLLDERYKMAVSDIDYCVDVGLAGMSAYYFGYAYAVHAEGKTRGATPEIKEQMFPGSWDQEKKDLISLFEKYPNIDWK